MREGDAAKAKRLFEEYRDAMRNLGVYVPNAVGYVEDWELFLPAVGYTDLVLLQHARRHWECEVRYHWGGLDVYMANPLPGPHPGLGAAGFVEEFGPPELDEFQMTAWLAVLKQHVDWEVRHRALTFLKEQLGYVPLLKEGQ